MQIIKLSYCPNDIRKCFLVLFENENRQTIWIEITENLCLK